MGGAATVCIQYEDGTRDSYMGYNRGMSIIPNYSHLLLAPDGERDAIAKALFKSEDEGYRDSYFESHPGLAPEWYGLNFIDLKEKRIWYCQGQNAIPIFHAWGLGNFYADDYNENVIRLAEAGILYYIGTLEEDVEYRKHRPRRVPADGPGFLRNATVEDVTRALEGKLTAKDRDGFIQYAVCAPGWEYWNIMDNPARMYEVIKAAGYELSEDEKKRWTEFLKDEEEE